MSGICGYAGEAPAGTLEAMLAAIDYRGDSVDTAVVPGCGLGYRFWKGRPGKSPGIHREGPLLSVVAGTFAPPVPSPAAALREALQPAAVASLDGAFAGACWDADASSLTLARDPFGVRSLYTFEQRGTLYFASEIKQLLAITGLDFEADPVALHKYLTFSFVPGEDIPLRGVRRLLPGHVATWRAGRLRTAPYFALVERLDPRLEDRKVAVRHVRSRCRDAVKRRLNGESEVGLFLSGGLDSSGVGVWLTETGVKVRAFSLDFGEKSVEREQARLVCERLQVPLSFVPSGGVEVGKVFWDLVHKLDLPFGDGVTGPQYLLGRAAREAGLVAVFNGEGGDQLFGGWTSKPMVAAEVYADLWGDDTREEAYLRSYHRFYGLEEQLYTQEFRASVGGPGQRRAHLRPYLGSPDAGTFLNRVRLADIALKGSQNILPRAERMSNGWGLDVRTPLFDRALAEASFRLPPSLKLHGATEKYVLKLALQRDLPKEVVWRRKFGMSVPLTDWVLGPLHGLVEELLGKASVEKRGLFRPEFVEGLRKGRSQPDETRRRRIGERLWCLLMLEAWLRVFVDGKGKKP